MTILTRYVVAETLKLLALSLIALTALLSISMAGKEAVRHGIPPLVVLQSMPYFVMQMLGYALPAAVLYSVCSVFGRMSASHELTALKSVGVNPMRLAEPVLAMTAIISMASVVTYDLTAVWGRPGIRKLIADSAAEIALGALRTQRSVALPWGEVHVRGIDGQTLVKPCIRMTKKDGTPAALLMASRGELAGDADGLHLTLCDFQANVGANTSIAHPGELKVPLPSEMARGRFHRDWLAMHQIPAGLARLERQRLAALDSLDEVDSPEETAEARRKLDRIAWKSRRFAAEPHRRWANGFSCVAFALVGIPVAIRGRSADAVSTFFVAFLPVLVVFYPLLMTSESLALSGWFPPWIFWLADAVLAAIGGILLRRAIAR